MACILAPLNKTERRAPSAHHVTARGAFAARSKLLAARRSLLPARRATRVEPLEALRVD
jgi:hypothetical protein